MEVARGRVDVAAMQAMPQLRPGMTFDEVCRAALAFLADTVPMDYWAVSRNIADRQLYLEVIDDAYGTVAGDSHAWSDSFCQHMVTGSAPAIAPDAMAVPSYAAAGVTELMSIGSYIGIPIETEDGTLFGTICGLDPAVKGVELYAQAPTLREIGRLLGQYLDDDRAYTERARAVEQARVRREADAHRMVDQAFWESVIDIEAPRLRRFGECAAVVAVAVEPAVQARAAEVLAGTTRATDVVSLLGDGGFGILARNLRPQDTPKLLARLGSALSTAGIPAALVHRDITVKEGLSTGWQAAAG